MRFFIWFIFAPTFLALLKARESCLQRHEQFKGKKAAQISELGLKKKTTENKISFMFYYIKINLNSAYKNQINE